MHAHNRPQHTCKRRLVWAGERMAMVLSPTHPAQSEAVVQCAHPSCPPNTLIPSHKQPLCTSNPHTQPNRQTPYTHTTDPTQSPAPTHSPRALHQRHATSHANTHSPAAAAHAQPNTQMTTHLAPSAAAVHSPHAHQIHKHCAPPLVFCRVPVHAIHAIATQNNSLADATVQGSTAPTTACNVTLPPTTSQLLGQRLQNDAPRPPLPKSANPAHMPAPPKSSTHLLLQLPAPLHQPVSGPLQQGQAGAMWCG